MHTESSRPPFDPAALRSALARGELRVPRIEWPAECPSTNDALAAGLAAAPEAWADLSVYGTDHQSAGHGRLGRTWTVPPGASLTFSTLTRLPEDFPAEALGWLPLITGYAVAEAVGACGGKAAVKWPNDVLIDGQKVCGILTRLCALPGAAEAGQAVIIGIGVNVDMTAEELPVPTATSLRLEGVQVSREELCAAILVRLAPGLAQLLSASSAAGFAASPMGVAVQSAMTTIGASVRAELPGDRRLTGTAVGVAADGSLIIDTGSGRETVSAGDVTHLRAGS